MSDSFHVRSNISVTEEDEDDDESWIPLSNTPQPPSTKIAHESSSAVISTSTSKSEAYDSSRHLQLTQQRLETKIHLTKNLVNHPIDLFWKRYIVNLAKEFLQLEVSKRLGLLLVISRLCLKGFLISTWYFWYPKLALTSAILIASFVYLDPMGLKMYLSPDSANHILEGFSTMQLRRTGVVVLLLPIALEMRTLSFLSEIHAEGSGGLWSLYNAMLGILMLSTMLFQHKIHHLSPRECIYQGLLTLYGSALIIATLKIDIARLPILAAPFLTATGTLLLTHQNEDMEWISRLFRQALRLTLRDVLSSVSQRVSTDELLQLTILRWIADYWASGGSNPEADDDPSRGSISSLPQETKTTQLPPSVSSSPPVEILVTSAATYQARPPVRQYRRFPRREVQWDDLLPMLSVAADHMNCEVQQLQSKNSDNPQLATTQSPTTFQEPTGNDGIQNLKFMLMSLNVDDRAKPAVIAYRRGVETLPPTKLVATIFSIIRRCPATLVLLCHIVLGSSSRFSSIMSLFPFVVLEYCRIKSWLWSYDSMAVARREENLQKKFSRIFEETDAMVLLLSGDKFSSALPPTLLLVWQNIVSSVSALEFGLTATRCVQTTTVAVDFAGNMMSLLNLGLEMSHHGLLHGLAIMAREIVTIHVNDHLPLDERRSVKYTGAAISAVQNANTFASNVKALAGEEELDPVLRPIVSALCILSGYGWLWGDESSEEKTMIDKDSTPRCSAQVEANGIDDVYNDAWKDLDKLPLESSATRKSWDNNDSAPAVGKENFAVSEIKSTQQAFDHVGGNDGVEELGQVMEMIAEAFESGIIEEVRFIESFACSCTFFLTDACVFSPRRNRQRKTIFALSCHLFQPRSFTTLP